MIQFSLGSVDCSVCHVRFRRLPLALLKRSECKMHTKFYIQLVAFQLTTNIRFSEQASDLDIAAGRSPISVAAAAIYMASQVMVIVTMSSQLYNITIVERACLYIWTPLLLVITLTVAHWGYKYVFYLTKIKGKNITSGEHHHMLSLLSGKRGQEISTRDCWCGGSCWCHNQVKKWVLLFVCVFVLCFTEVVNTSCCLVARISSQAKICGVFLPNCHYNYRWHATIAGKATSWCCLGPVSSSL